MPWGGKIHQPPAVLNQLRDAVYKDKVPQVVGSELRLETIRSLAEWGRHHASVGNDHIEQSAVGDQLVRGSAHALQAREVQFNQLEARALLRRGLAHLRCRPLR